MTKNCIVINIPGNGETEHKNYCAGIGAVLAKQGIGYKVFPVQNFKESGNSPSAGAEEAIKVGSKVDFQQLQKNVFKFMYAMIEKSKQENKSLPRFVFMGHSLGVPAMVRIVENIKHIYNNIEVIAVDGLDNTGKLISKLSTTSSYSKKEKESAAIALDAEIDSTKTIIALKAKGIQETLIHSENDRTLTRGFTSLITQKRSLDYKKLERREVDVRKTTLSSASKDKDFESNFTGYIAGTIKQLLGYKGVNTSVKDKITEEIEPYFQKYYKKYYNDDHRRNLVFHTSSSKHYNDQATFNLLLDTIRKADGTVPLEGDHDVILRDFCEEIGVKPEETLSHNLTSHNKDEPITNEYLEFKKITMYVIMDVLKDKRLQSIMPEDFQESGVLKNVIKKGKSNVTLTDDADRKVLVEFLKSDLYKSILGNLLHEHREIWEENFGTNHGVQASAPAARPGTSVSSVGVGSSTMFR